MFVLRRLSCVKAMQSDKLLTRLKALAQTSLDDVLAESPDPQAAAAHWRAEANKGLAQAQDALAAAVAQEHQLDKRLAEAQALDAEWDAKTDAALQAGDEDGARRALKRKMAYEASVAELRQSLDRQRQVVADMKASVNALRDKVQEMVPPAVRKPLGSGSKTP